VAASADIAVPEASSQDVKAKLTAAETGSFATSCAKAVAEVDNIEGAMSDKVTVEDVKFEVEVGGSGTDDDEDADDADDEPFDPFGALGKDKNATDATEDEEEDEDEDVDAGDGVKSVIQWVAHPDKCVTIDGDSASDGTDVNGATCAEKNTQQHWKIPAGTGQIQSAKFPDMCLEVEGAGGNGDNVAMHKCGPAPVPTNQQWIVPAEGTGQIAWAQEKTMCLDAKFFSGEESDDPTKAQTMIIWNCHDDKDPLHENQMWHFAMAE